MTVISRLTTAFALSAFIATSLVAPVAGSSGDDGTAHVLDTRDMHVLEPRSTHPQNHPQPQHQKKDAHPPQNPHQKKAPLHNGHQTSNKKGAGKSRHHEVAKHHQSNAGQHGKKTNWNCKTGLGWTQNQFSQEPFWWGSCWCYNWSPWKCSDHLESVPMLWDAKQIGDWNSQVKGKYWEHILAINEPEQPGQAAMSVGAAVSLWKQHVEPINAGQRGSPAVTTSPAGMKWIANFIEQCKGCRINFFCAHYYGTSVSNFIELIEEFHKTVGYQNVWVTEWGCQDYSGKNQQCSQSQTNNFVKETKAWMDKQDWIIRYSYYGMIPPNTINVGKPNSMMTNQGKPNALANIYLG